MKTTICLKSEDQNLVCKIQAQSDCNQK